MSDSQKVAALLAKAHRLKQNNETWQGTSRLGRYWITPKHEPAYRPYMLAIARQVGALRRHDLLPTVPTTAQVFELLLQGMLRPTFGSGRAVRPQKIWLDTSDLVAELTPLLAELGIDCEYNPHLPNLEAVLKKLEKMMHRGREPVKGLLSVATVTPPLVKHLYELAADFYQVKPWQWLNDLYPIEICYPLNAKPRYVVVMGSGGEFFGLSVYDTLADLQLIYDDEVSNRQASKRASWLVFFFSEAIAMSFDDLDDAAKYSWPIAHHLAYPIFGRTTKQSLIEPPTAADMFWLEAAMVGILTYCQDYKQIKKGILQPTEITLSVKTLAPQPQQLKLRLPVLVPALDRPI